MSKRERLAMHGEKVTVTIPRWILDATDDLAKEIEGSRSDVVTALLAYCFLDDANEQKDEGWIIDEVFPYREEEGESEEE